MSSAERAALLALVQDAEGKAWSSRLRGWSADSSVPTCDWDGVTCRISLDGSSPPAVAELALPARGLSGTIPTELGLLTELTSLNVAHNILRGPIPDEVAGLEKLVTLNLTETFLTGTLPQRFASSRLTTLALANNAISGRFFHADDSPHLRSVTEIRMENNLLTGTLHGRTLARMPLLETLSLSANDLSGLLPGEELGSLPELRYLYVDANHFVGPLPAQLAQAGRSRILELWVQDNALSGTVPASYVRFDKLHDFYIDGNKLTGALPPELCGPEINADFFVEAPPEAERNYCDSIACPAGSVAFEGVYPCEKCPGGEAARLRNRYLGQTGHCSNYSQRDVLRLFHDATTKGGAWSGISDWDDESKGVCDMSGVTCDAHGNIVGISLKNRKLEGHLPDEIGHLSFLETLDVSDNDLMGYLPSDLQWTSVTRLDVSGNRIRGIIPPLLCMMEGLNGNGEDNVFYCDRIACPAGTYNKYGYHHGADGDTCAPCYDGSPFIGQKACARTTAPRAPAALFKMAEDVTDQMGLSAGVAIGIIVGVVPILILAIFWLVRCWREGHTKQYDTMGYAERGRLAKGKASYYSDSDEDDEEMDDYSFSVPGEKSQYRDREYRDFVIADENGDEEGGGAEGAGGGDPSAAYDDDNVSRATTRSATELMSEHRGVALNRREKIKKAISRNLSGDLGRRASAAASSINVSARRLGSRTRSSTRAADDYHEEEHGAGGRGSRADVELVSPGASVKSSPGALDGGAYGSKELQSTDLLDVPMIT